jgi:GxxExxY protein
LDLITKQIICCAYNIGNTLGHGFLEKVYENALAHELSKSKLKVEQQKSVKVIYDNVVVGDYTADFLVEEKVIVELKAVSEINDIHMSQCMNYLKAMGSKVCLLINFGKPKVEIKRIVHNF